MNQQGAHHQVAEATEVAEVAEEAHHQVAEVAEVAEVTEVTEVAEVAKKTRAAAVAGVLAKGTLVVVVVQLWWQSSPRKNARDCYWSWSRNCGRTRSGYAVAAWHVQCLR